MMHILCFGIGLQVNMVLQNIIQILKTVRGIYESVFKPDISLV